MEIQVLKLRNALGLLEGLAAAKTRQTKTSTTSSRTRHGKAKVVKDTVPAILSNILLQDGQAIATDLDTAISVYLPEVVGQYLVPCKPVSKMLRYVHGDEMLTLEMRGGSLHMAWKGGAANYQIEKAQDYPVIPQVVPMARFSVLSDALIPAMLELLDYAAEEVERPVLNGVSLFLGSPLEIAAGDGYRMAYKTLPISMNPSGGINTIIIPSRAVLQLAHIWEKEPKAANPLDDSLIGQIANKGAVGLDVSNSMLKATYGRVSLITRTVDGTPPNFKQLIPAEMPNAVQIYAPDLDRAVNRLYDAAVHTKGIVRLSWTNGTMTLTVNDDSTVTVESTIPVQTLNGEGHIALNIKYLREYIRDRSGLVVMATKDVSSPAVFRQGNSPVVVIMPMFVQWPDQASAQQPAPPEAAAAPASEDKDEITEQELESATEQEAAA